MHEAISTFSQNQLIKINKGKKKRCKSWTPSDKNFWIRHDHFGPLQTTFLPTCGTLTFMKYLEQWKNGLNYRYSTKDTSWHVQAAKFYINLRICTLC